MRPHITALFHYFFLKSRNSDKNLSSKMAVTKQFSSYQCPSRRLFLISMYWASLLKLYNDSNLRYVMSVILMIDGYVFSCSRVPVAMSYTFSVADMFK